MSPMTRRTGRNRAGGPASVLGVLLFVLASGLALSTAPAEARSHHHHRAAPSAPGRPALDRKAIGFRTHALLVEHFQKHGSEFGRITIDQYLGEAQALRDRPAGGDVLEMVRRDGTVARFDRRSGAFLAFDADGTIRTFFRPRAGERYFRRQAERGDP